MLFFYEKEPKLRRGRKSQSNDEEQTSWFKTFQFLIECGHRPADILQMSYGTFTGYLKAAQKNQAAKLQVQTNLIHSAQHANAKGFVKLIEEVKPSKD